MDETPTERRELRPQELPTRAPRVLKQRFELLEPLGEGGMGVVYKALDYQRRKSRDPVVHIALKVLSESMQQHKDAMLALQREFSRTLQVTHPNIVRTYDFDTDESQNIAFLTMELLEGESLEAMLKRHPDGLPADRYLPLLQQLLDGLECAHRHGIVHSDLKPSNIFITQTGQLKIMDFGIAAPLRPVDDLGPGTLFDPRKLGALSPSHACLEMFAGMTADLRDDLYSLGCVVYQLASGRHPFNGKRAPHALDEQLTVRPLPALSESANEALRAALQFHRADRIGSVDEFRRKFFDSEPARSRKGTLRWAMIAVAAAVLVAVVAWQLNRFAGGPAISQQPPAAGVLELSQATEPGQTAATSKQPAGAPPAAMTNQAAPKSLVAGNQLVSASPIASAGVAMPASGTQPALAANDAAFLERCGWEPSYRLLDHLVQDGLQKQAFLNFSGGSLAEITHAEDMLVQAAECIQALHARKISSADSLKWLPSAQADADAIKRGRELK